MSAGYLVSTIIQFYITLIVIYVLMSWFPMKGVLADVYQVLGTLVEPYLGIFRRIIPPIGMIDISAIIAILVLQALGSLLQRLL